MAYGIGHYDYRAVAFDCAYKGKSYSLVAARRFYDDAVFVEFAFFFSALDHVESRARLNGTADVQAFVLNENVSCAFGYYVIQLNKRRVSDCLKDIVVDHYDPPLLVIRTLLYKVFYTVADLYIFISKIVPFPSSLSQEIVPFWEFIICFASDKPMPLLLGSDFSPW